MSHPAPRHGGATGAIVVPHTHWDREWHSPFETMRSWLVWFFDQLIDAVESDPDLPVFVLDGQVVMIEDYLDVRPEQRPRLVRLITAGRLRPGPFYVQPDEFLPAGESLIRNLLMGVRLSMTFGWVMREGYLPDSFGHVEQLPQILRGFGIGTFYGMRGVGADLGELGSEFWWVAPDGSRVLATALAGSYSNAAVLHEDAEQMALPHGSVVSYRTLSELLGRLSRVNRTGVLLLLNGGDHLGLQQGIPELTSALDEQVAPALRLGGLEEYQASITPRTAGLRTFSGELRSGRYHDILEGVASTRAYLKRAMAEAEASVCTAERLDVMAWLLDGQDNRPLLRHAWKLLLHNCAHDSITGCSVDAVHEEMQLRFRQIGQVAGAVTGHSLQRIGACAAPAQRSATAIPVVVVNPSPWQRTGVVVAGVVPDPGVPIGERRFGWEQAGTIEWQTAALLDETGAEIPFELAGEELSVEDLLNRRKEVQRTRLRFVATDVPPAGTRTYRLAIGRRTSRIRPRDGGGATSLANAHLEIRAAADGTLTLIDRRTGARFTRQAELIDEADAGDEYTFAPLPDQAPLSSATLRWDVQRAAHDTLRLRTTWPLPAGLSADRRARSAGTAGCPVTMMVTLPEHAEFARLDIAIDNRARDHRLSVRFPTGLTAARAYAETAFGVISRPDQAAAVADRGAAKDWKDRPSGCHPAGRFVSVAGNDHGRPGLTVLAHGVREYRHDAGDLRLTLLRSVGWLSRDDIASRPHPAGPPIATPGAQCLGPGVSTLALMPHYPAQGWGRAFRAAEELAAPLLGVAVQGSRAGSVMPPPLLQVRPDCVVLSALKLTEEGDGIAARIYNTAGHSVTAVLTWGWPVAAAARTDLGEEPVEELSAAGRQVCVALGPATIATVRVALDTARPTS